MLILNATGEGYNLISSLNTMKIELLPTINRIFLVLLSILKKKKILGPILHNIAYAHQILMLLLKTDIFLLT